MAWASGAMQIQEETYQRLQPRNYDLNNCSPTSEKKVLNSVYEVSWRIKVLDKW